MNFIRQFAIILSAIFVISGQALAEAPPCGSDEIQQRLRDKFSALDPGANPLPEPVFGETLFLPLAHLKPGQVRLSYLNMLDKLNEFLPEGAGQHACQYDNYSLNHDNGRSLYPAEDPVEAVWTSEGPVLVDGHHSVGASYFAGAQSIAVTILDERKYLDLAGEDLWAELVGDSRAFLTLRDGITQLAKPPIFPELFDDPNRFWVAALAKKIITSQKEGPLPIVSKVKQLVAEPLWAKVNNEVPFMEFYLAQALYKQGIVYQPEWGLEISPENKDAVISVFRSVKAKDARMSQLRIYGSEIEVFGEKEQPAVEAGKMTKTFTPKGQIGLSPGDIGLDPEQLDGYQVIQISEVPSLSAHALLAFDPEGVLSLLLYQGNKLTPQALPGLDGVCSAHSIFESQEPTTQASTLMILGKPSLCPEGKEFSYLKVFL